MSFDISAYMGDWYEVGRLPFMFENNCESSSARYIYNKNLKIIQVANFCYSDSYFSEMSHFDMGVAKPSTSESGGDLRIRFDRYPEFESDYVVYETDYISYSIVGSIDKSLLWILTREKKISRKALNSLIEKTKKFEFDLRFLILNNSMIY